MNAHEAHIALAPLIAGTQGWNDETVKLFTSELSALTEPDILAEACRDVLWSWKRLGRPGLAEIAEAYNVRVARLTPVQDELELPAEPTMTLPEYLDRLAWRAGTGDTAAAADLTMWERVRHGPYVEVLL